MAVKHKHCQYGRRKETTLFGETPGTIATKQ